MGTLTLPCAVVLCVMLLWQSPPGTAAEAVSLRGSVEGELQVQPGQTAELRDDTVVTGKLSFAAGSRLVVRGPKPRALIIRGQLVASGTEKQPVVFGAGLARPGGWTGIVTDGQVKLEWAVVQGADVGITQRKGALELASVCVRYCNQGISAHSNVQLTNCLVARNSGDGVYVQGVGVVLQKTSILSNDGWGVRTGHGPRIKLDGCSIVGNAQGGLWLGCRQSDDPCCEASKCNVHDNGALDVKNDKSPTTVDGCYLGAATTREIGRKGEKSNLTRIFDLYDGAVAPVTITDIAKERIKDAGCALDLTWLRAKGKGAH